MSDVREYVLCLEKICQYFDKVESRYYTDIKRYKIAMIGKSYYLVSTEKEHEHNQ